MRHRRHAIHRAAIATVILAASAFGTKLAAEDAPRRDCPLCGHEGVAFENSPKGVFSKLRYALMTDDTDLLRDCILDEQEEAALDHSWQGADFWLRCKLERCDVSGESAILVVTVGDDRRWRFHMVERDDVWQFDDDLARQGEKLANTRDCANNLKQLGLYLVMYVSKYGKDETHPPPGAALLTTLFTQPTSETAVARGGEALLLCRESGETNTPESVRKGDAGATSYECYDQQLTNMTMPYVPIAWDKKPCHDGRRNVLFFDGHVETLTEEELRAARERR